MAGGDSDLLTPAEAVALVGVHPKTLARWADAGRLASVRTLGGQRRYWRAEIEEVAAGRVPRPQPVVPVSVPVEVPPRRPAQWITAEQACRLARIRGRTLARWIAEGIVVCRHDDGHLRVLRPTVEVAVVRARKPR